MRQYSNSETRLVVKEVADLLWFIALVVAIVGAVAIWNYSRRAKADLPLDAARNDNAERDEDL